MHLGKNTGSCLHKFPKTNVQCVAFLVVVVVVGVVIVAVVVILIAESS